MSDALEITEAAVCTDRIAEHQRAQHLNDASLVRAFPALGSARSWRRLAAHDWGAMPLDVWLPKLQAVVAQLDGTPPAGRVAIAEGAPTAFVTRHLTEADRCRRENSTSLARSHCRAARQAIEDFQRSL
ncbi:hypothetical protein [Horticoccus sp. 23ND18S-11]|uniref:hypothetical protein n=1 Tax=Horticoccus sp. 23ND18S-11 TaxID=3391832 RepID=UPI0039C9BF04